MSESTYRATAIKSDPHLQADFDAMCRAGFVDFGYAVTLGLFREYLGRKV